MYEAPESHLAHTMCLKNISSNAIDYCLLSSMVVFGRVSVHCKPHHHCLTFPSATPEGGQENE